MTGRNGAGHSVEGVGEDEREVEEEEEEERKEERVVVERKEVGRERRGRGKEGDDAGSIRQRGSSNPARGVRPCQCCHTRARQARTPCQESHTHSDTRREI